MLLRDVIALENDLVRVRIAPDCSGTLVDKASGTEWNFHPIALQEDGPIMTNVVWNRTDRSFCDYYAGRFAAEPLGEGAMRVRVLGPFHKDKGAFTCKVLLDGPWVEFRIEEIDEALPSLVFPPHIHSDSLVLPTGVGKWMKKPTNGAEFWTQATHLNMRWVGGLKDDAQHGWMAIYGDGYADSGGYLNGLAMAPTWLKSLEKWTPTRSIRYCCVSGGYVEMAKVFRRYAQENGLFRSLQEKIDVCPALKTLLGGRILSFFLGSTLHTENYLERLQPVPSAVLAHAGQVEVKATYADVAGVIAQAKALGMQRGVFNVRGALRGGYDEMHPDIWPAETAYGSEAELRALFTQPDNFVTMLHDNYQDTYPQAESFPEGVIHLPNGDLMPGGYWHGGQCYLMNPEKAMKFVVRNWDGHASFNPRGLFVDTMASVQFYQDYNPASPLTRTRDWQAKTAMMQFYKSKGIMLGSENAGDFGMGYLDFLENRHANIPGDSIPLWPLVYHDAGFYARYPSNGTSGGKVGRMLEEALWGYAVMWPASTLQALMADAEAFQRSLALDALHARTGMDEMVNHRYLTEDGRVEQTEFSSGISVIANFAHEPRTVNGIDLPAQDYRVVE